MKTSASRDCRDRYISRRLTIQLNPLHQQVGIQAWLLERSRSIEGELRITGNSNFAWEEFLELSEIKVAPAKVETKGLAVEIVFGASICNSAVHVKKQVCNLDLLPLNVQ